MPLPPTIPTSFVPHPGGQSQKRYRADFTGAFAFFAYGILGLAVLLALGVFIYGRILAGDQAAKDSALAKAQANIDPATVEGFIRLRDRLSAGAKLLDSHIAMSGFFAALGSLMPTTVQFSATHLTIDDTGTTKLDATGVAKNFNALAATSAAFASDGRIKDAIFSNISINKDGSVNFALTATLDPKLIAYTPSASAPAASGSAGASAASQPAATSSAASGASSAPPQGSNTTPASVTPPTTP